MFVRVVNRMLHAPCALKNVNLTDSLLKDLNEVNAQEVGRIEELFKKYFSRLRDANVKLDVFVFLVQEKNAQFETNLSSGAREDLLIFLNFFLHGFWRFVQKGYEVETFAQFFSQRVTRLKPEPLNMRLPVKCNEATERLRIECRKLYIIEQGRYQSVLDLNKKICTQAKKYATLLVTAFDQVGRYAQTVANGGFPLCCFRSIWRAYHIPLPVKDERDSKQRTIVSSKRGLSLWESCS